LKNENFQSCWCKRVFVIHHQVVLLRVNSIQEEQIFGAWVGKSLPVGVFKARAAQQTQNLRMMNSKRSVSSALARTEFPSLVTIWHGSAWLSVFCLSNPMSARIERRWVSDRKHGQCDCHKLHLAAAYTENDQSEAHIAQRRGSNAHR